MSANYFGLVEMAFTLLVVLGWGFWELYKLKKEK
jgi:hypothetical protein